MFRSNPLDTMGIICDFCAQPGVVHIYECTPFMLGGIMRAQFMACSTCRDLITTKNIRALITASANMLPQQMRRQARSMFNQLYTTFFSNLIKEDPISPADIFDLHMLRARTKVTKCQLNSAPNCSKIAMLLLNINGWQPSCAPCVFHELGISDPKDIVGHPLVRNLY